MHNKFDSVLKEMYDYYKNTGRARMTFKPNDNNEKSLYYDAIGHLEKKGLLTEVYTAMGFIEFKLSDECIDYFDNNQL